MARVEQAVSLATVAYLATVGQQVQQPTRVLVLQTLQVARGEQVTPLAEQAQ